MELPKSQRQAILELAALTAEQREGIIRFLRGEKPILDITRLGQNLAEFVELEVEVAERILLMVSMMYRARLVSELSAEDFAAAVGRTINTTPGLDIPQRSADAIRDFLSVVLSFENSVGIAARGRSLLFEQERYLTSARILTDFRPVFSDEPEVAPLAGVILHRLKVEYDEEGQDKAFWVTLESGDLELLRDVVDRALLKEQNLRSALDGTLGCLR